MATKDGTFMQSLIPRVQDLLTSRIRIDLTGSAITTFAIGGKLRAVVTIDSPEQCASVLKLLQSEGQFYRVLGNGSNLLISDSGVDEWVLRLGSSLRGFESLPEDCFRVHGAASLMAVARRLSEQGFAGLEFAAGIPASLGGAICMNAGAHGNEIGEMVSSVNCTLKDGSSVELTGREISWSYRYSGLPIGCVVTSAVLKLPRGDKEAISARCADNLRERRLRQPLAMPSAGSVFKNVSPERSAGSVLDELGMKGKTVGGASVSIVHANWIVNAEKRATAADVSALISLCQEEALNKMRIRLETEVRLWQSPGR